MGLSENKLYWCLRGQTRRTKYKPYYLLKISHLWWDWKTSLVTIRGMLLNPTYRNLVRLKSRNERNMKSRDPV